MSRTVAQVIERIYREYLTPADDYPSFTHLVADINSSDTQLTYDADFLLLEEEDLLDAGIIIEIDRELIVVGDVDFSAKKLAGLRRGAMGTTAASHAAEARIIIQPEVTRQAVFDAILEELENLHPPLYRVGEVEAWSDNWELPADAWSPLESLYHDGGGWRRGGGFDIVRSPDSSTGLAARLRAPCGERNLLRFKARFGVPTSEQTDLTSDSIGMDRAWEAALVVGAVAHLISGADLKARTQEFITEAIERLGYPVGSTERLRNSLLSYREFLVTREANRLKQRDGIPATAISPWPGYEGW